MLVAGEEPLYLLRRLTRAAVEDIGMADPNALVQCLAAKEMYDFLGSPEGEIGIVQACLYLATAPKSNATYTAQKKAWRSAAETRLADAADAHPQCADEDDEERRATARATPMTIMPRKASPAKTIGPRKWNGKAFTSPPIGASRRA